jgi:2-keto-4-pentenoate hydratase/2-oxohepta-3-ene-1,7-dioic acid hydratase in catechol pathway
VAQPPKDHLPDYEVELVIVIGKAAKDVSEADALDYVLGYTGANDVCIRFSLIRTPSGILIAYHRFLSVNTNCPSHNGGSQRVSVRSSCIIEGRPLTIFVDNTNPLGPCLVSNNVISDPQNILLKCTVNGKVLQDGTTAYVPHPVYFIPISTDKSFFSEQIFTVRQTVAFLSQGTTLEPGSIILTGTPKGVGFVKKPAVYLQDGDKMSVWLGNGIGTLVNDVQEEKASTKVVSKL